MPTSRKPIISYRPYSGYLLILMPRIRILYFPGPELACLCKKIKKKIVLKNPKIHWQFLSNLAISGPEKCKIWNLGKISEIPNYGL